MRCFIGIPIDQALLPRILDIQKRFKRFGNVLKFVEPENLHFTVKFLGEVSETTVEKIKSLLNQVFSELEPFEIMLKGIGVFPNQNCIRVVWVGVASGKEKLSWLMEEVDNALHSLGFPREATHVPHLTLFRVKAKPPREHFVKLLNELEDVYVGEMTVKEIILYRSTLTPNGPIYTRLHRWEL
jgi:2'-5' RNA ligase